MSNLSFAGKVKTVYPVQTGEGKNGPWSKQTVVIEEDGDYPNSFAFDTFKTEILENVSEGDYVEVMYNGKTSDFNGKTYNSLTIWKLDIKGGGNPQSSNGTTTSQTTSKATPPSVEDDLPF